MTDLRDAVIEAADTAHDRPSADILAGREYPSEYDAVMAGAAAALREVAGTYEDETRRLESANAAHEARFVRRVALHLLTAADEIEGGKP